MTENAWKQYTCPNCGSEHYVGLNIEMSNGVNCGSCENGKVREEDFNQVELYKGKVERNKKPVKTFKTVEEYHEHR